MLLKYCCLDSIPIFVRWAGITKVSFDINLIFAIKTLIKAALYLEVFFQFWMLRFENPSSIYDGSSRSLYPMTLLFILLQSSVVESSFHILFNICPYSGSSLKWWSLSSIIIALMQLSQCLLDKLENKCSRSDDPTGSSCRLSPANMIVNPPKGLALFPISFSLHQVFQDFYHSWIIPC